MIARCAKAQRRERPKRIGIIDVSRAYLSAECRKPLCIRIPPEGWEPDNESNDGRRNLTLYGTRDAAQNWAATYTKHLTNVGLKQGKASKCSFRNEAKDIDLAVHGDDFLIVADEGGLRWMESEMGSQYEVKCSV